MILAITLFCLSSLFGLLCAYVRKKYKYWREKGLYGPKPSFPVGNLEGVLTGKKSAGMHFSDMYKQTKDHPYVGIFMALRPTLLVNDPEQIRNVLIKDFAHFTDHFIEFNEKTDPLAAHLFNLKGDQWKNLRTKLTPTFTTSKIKSMFDTVNSCAEVMMNYLETSLMDGCDEDVMEIMAKFTTDVIGTCAFGIECDSFKNPNSDFRKMGKRVFHLSPYQVALQCLQLFFPNMVSKLKLRIIDKEMNDFFCNLVKNTIEYRKKNNVVRNDFLQLLIQMKDKDATDSPNATFADGTKLTLMGLTAQVFMFFLAGFETSSTTASFALYELALNPDIQREVGDEIDNVMAKHGGKLTYDSLGEMTYLTRVIEETFRKHPPSPILFRMCTKDYILPGTDIKIEKDTPVLIPVFGIQRDPDIYPNPDKFDPERFSTENKASINNVSYLPFGEGPRICIGSRLGMMQTKLGLATFLSKYEVSVCDKTPIPIVYSKKSFVLTSDDGICLKIKYKIK